MKTAIYIEDGTVQLVITPESDFEKNALKSFSEKPMSAKLFSGSFYDCRGGWVRQSDYNGRLGYENERNDQSLILRMTQELTLPEQSDQARAEKRNAT